MSAWCGLCFQDRDPGILSLASARLTCSHPTVLEVLVFGRDAGMAEAWLCSQEPLVRSAELGCTVDEVESLIKRHEAFQKSAVAWEERFSALEKLTAVRTRELWGARPNRASPATPLPRVSPIYPPPIPGYLTPC